MYIFNHIPKTGGTTMYRILERLIGSDRLSPHFSMNEDTEYPLTLAGTYDRYLVIFGHLSAASTDVLGPRRKWLTILRDPVDRVISQYYFWRNCVPSSPHLDYVYEAQTLSLEKFCRLRTTNFLQGNENLQTWQLGDDLRVRYRRVASCDVLETAKRNIDERCAFVGLFEDYPGSVRRLCGC
jgi:hypothetical protein